MLGTEAEFKRTIDAAKGDGLDADDRYRKAIDGLDDDRLGTFYVDVKALIDQAALREDPEAAQQLEQVKRLFPVDKIGPVAGAFVADGDGSPSTPDRVPEGRRRHRRAQLDLRGAVDAARRAAGRLVARRSARRRLGETLKRLYQQAAGALGGAAIENQLRQELGLDLQQDVFSWIGDVAVFARGTDDGLDRGRRW